MTKEKENKLRQEYVQVLGCFVLVVQWQVLSNSSHLWLMRFLNNHVYGGHSLPKHLSRSQIMMISYRSQSTFLSQ